MGPALLCIMRNLIFDSNHLRGSSLATIARNLYIFNSFWGEARSTKKTRVAEEIHFLLWLAFLSYKRRFGRAVAVLCSAGPAAWLLFPDSFVSFFFSISSLGGIGGLCRASVDVVRRDSAQFSSAQLSSALLANDNGCCGLGWAFPMEDIRRARLSFISCY